MALTNRRWLLCAALGVAVLGVAYLPPREVLSRFRLEWELGEPAERRFLVSRAHLTSALEETILAEEIDALRRGRTRFLPARSGVSTELRGNRSPRVAREFQARVQQVWANLPHADTTLRLRVLGWRSSPDSPYDAAPIDPRPDRIRFVPPAATDGRTCLVLLPSVWVPDSNRVQEVEVGGLGPCALHAAFGPPGAAMGEWLEQTGYDLAHDMGWATGESVPTYRRWRGPLVEDPATQAVAEIVAPMFGVVNPAYEGGVGSAACAAGAAEACHRVLLEPAFRRDANVSRASPGIVLTQHTYFGGDGRIGPVSGRWINDLIRDEGRERFATFWRSAERPDSAFRLAYHQTMAGWTKGWMREQYGAIAAGAGLTMPAGAGAVLTACLTVLFAGLAARWRTLD